MPVTQLISSENSPGIVNQYLRAARELEGATPGSEYRVVNSRGGMGKVVCQILFVSANKVLHYPLSSVFDESLSLNNNLIDNLWVFNPAGTAI